MGEIAKKIEIHFGGNLGEKKYANQNTRTWNKNQGNRLVFPIEFGEVSRGCGKAGHGIRIKRSPCKF